MSRKTFCNLWSLFLLSYAQLKVNQLIRKLLTFDSFVVLQCYFAIITNGQIKKIKKKRSTGG